MSKIRHLAIWTEDTDRMALFYKEVFGLEELYREERKGGKRFLTDGYFNLALLPNDKQNAPNGLYHFGFEVESADETIEKIKKLNMSRLPKPRTASSPYAEIRASDPDGNFFDISEHSFLEPKEKRGMQAQEKS